MRKNISLLIVIAVILQIFNITIHAETENIIYVATHGNDSNSGSEEEPVKSLEMASLLAKESIESGKESVTVKIHGGKYFVENTAYSASGVTYEAMGDGEVILTQTKQLDRDKFKKLKAAEILLKIPQNARPHILEYDLNADGINLSTEDKFRPFFYVDNKEQILSKYPNDHYLISSGATGNTRFTVTDERVYNWQQATDAYIFGSLDATYFWRIKRITDISGNTITLEGNIRNNCEWYIENLLEEIDIPGEYYVDREKGKLYYYPKGEFLTAEIVMNDVDILNISNASDVKIHNITFDKCGGRAIYGTVCNNISILNNNFRFIQGVDAVRIEGQDCTVSENYAYGCMGSFVHFEGGVIKTLTPGNMIIENNRISFCGRRNFTNVISSGNSISGSLKSCGNIIRNNIIQDCMTFSAIGGKANDYLIENNEIYNNGYLMDDAGAIYYGKSNIQYGNVIKNNYIHDLNKERSYCGIYPDDGFSGVTIINNVVKDAQKGIIMNYGMNNIVEGNMFINTKNGMVGGSVMGSSTPAALYTETYNALTKSVYKDTFKNAYPEMSNSLSRKPFFAPWNTSVVGNVQIGGATIVLKDRPWHILNDNIDDLSEEELNKKGALTYNSGGYHGSNWVSGTKVDELKAYGKTVVDSEGNDLNGTVLGNPAYGYSDSYFVNPEKQDYTLKVDLNSDISTVGNINMSKVGILTDMPGENGENVEIIYPLDGSVVKANDVPFVWETCENASEYRLVVSENSDLSLPVIDEVFTETYSDRVMIKSLEPEKTYYVKMYAYGIGKQNTFITESKTIKFLTANVGICNDESLMYAIQIAEEKAGEYCEDETLYTEELYERLSVALMDAKNILSSPTATQEEFNECEENIYDVLSEIDEFISLTGEITKCEPSQDTSEIFIEGKNFMPDKMVSVLVTNPGFGIADTAENVDLERIQFASTVKADENGKISFSFNTIVRGNDMPGEYKVYISDEFGRMYEKSYIYGTIEVGEIVAKNEQGDVLENLFGSDVAKLSCEIKNRSSIELNPIIITAFYNDGVLVRVNKIDNQKIDINSNALVSWDALNLNGVSDVSEIKVMFMDSLVSLKPLTTSRIIYSEEG